MVLVLTEKSVLLVSQNYSCLQFNVCLVLDVSQRSFLLLLMTLFLSKLN